MQAPDIFYDDSGELWFYSTQTQVLIKALEERKKELVESWIQGAFSDQRANDGAVAAVQDVESMLGAIVDIAVGQPPEGVNEESDQSGDEA